MEKTFVPCTRALQIFDQNSGQVSPAYDYKVARESSGFGEAISVCIDEDNGTEMVYVAGVFEPVASMLPGQTEDDEMLFGLYQGWASSSTPFLEFKVERKTDHYVMSSIGGRQSSVLCYSKNLSYVKSRIRKFAGMGDVKVEWRV